MSFNDGDASWILASTCLVMIMIPGLGYFYSGLARHKNALSLIFLSFVSLVIVSIQWFIWGFSLAFSEEGGRFIGNLKYAFFMNMFGSPNFTFVLAPTIPGAVFMIYQCMFAAITPAIAFGGAAERTRIIPCIVFLFLWSTLVYDFIAYWTWAPNGWLKALGSVDFAGGTPVHISSGGAALAFSIVTGRRVGYGTKEFKPHNLSTVFLGTALLWFGWFGFNGGSELAGNTRAGLAIVNTNLAAAFGGLTWLILDYRHEKKLSAFALCSGIVAGLVAITPGAGFVYPWAAMIFGILGSCACILFLSFKQHFFFDDALDVFGVHGIGGITGNILTGIFGTNTIVNYDGPSPALGWIDGNWIQILYQLCGSVVGFTWSFVVTLIILTLMNKLPYLNLRLTKEDEEIGVDKAQLGDTAYDYFEANVGGNGSVDGSPKFRDTLPVNNNSQLSLLPSTNEKNYDKSEVIEMKKVEKPLSPRKPSAKEVA